MSFPTPPGTGFSQEAVRQMERLAGDLRSIYITQKAMRSDDRPPARKILVVEDQAEIRNLIRMTVKLEDHEVHEAADGDTGLAMALELQPDLVLLDVTLPGVLDGLQVCRALKALPTPPHVLLLTARRGKEDIRAGRDAGADAYNLKPISPLQLIDLIDQQLGIK